MWAKRLLPLRRRRPNGRRRARCLLLRLHRRREGGLPLAARVNEAFTVELLAHVPGALAAGTGAATESPDLPKKQGELLQRALYDAGHFNREDIVKKLVAVSVQLINNSKPLVTEFVALWKKMGVFLAKEEDDLVPDDEGAVRVPLYRSISLCNLAEEEKQ